MPLMLKRRKILMIRVENFELGHTAENAKINQLNFQPDKIIPNKHTFSFLFDINLALFIPLLV